MYYILEHVRNSQNAKVCLLLGFCFITTIIILNRPSDTPSVRTREMSDEVKVGGLGDVLESDDEVVEVVGQVKPILEEKTGKKFESIDVIHYKPQSVAGRNYFVKAQAKEVDGVEQIIHLRIYKDLSRKVELTAYKLDMKLDDEMKYFQ